MKVKRQGLTESYRTTADWVSEFEKNLEKQGNYLDNLKSVLKKRNDFSTIEEKMADIRARAGFDIIKDVEKVNISKKASECSACMDGCECGEGCDCPKSCNCCKCSCGEYTCKRCNSSFIKKVKNVINYMQEFSKDRPDAGVSVIMTHCREHPELNFKEVESKVDNKKFKILLEKLLNKSEDLDKEVKYIPDNGDNEVESDVADYFQHAQTTG